MMKRRILSLALALAVCLGLAVPALAAEIVDSGKCGDDLTWTLDSEGTLTISGTGEMWDIVNDEGVGTAPWNKGSDVVNTSVRAVDIKAGVASIGQGAFRGHVKLSDVSIPSSVTSIRLGAFLGCQGLKSLSVPEGVIDIGYGAFAMCWEITNISIPSSVVSIGESAFVEDRSLEQISVASGNDRYMIADGALYDKKEQAILCYPSCRKEFACNLPSGTVSILESAFMDCDNLTSIFIPTSVTTIGYAAFSGCNSLNDIYYGGNKYAWDAILIYDQNDPLADAAIHYDTSAQPSIPIISASVFTDVPSSDFYTTPVAWAVKQGITTGTSTTTFSPFQDCTNAQILTFLWRSCGEPEPSIENPFTNSIPDSYRQAAVWAYEQGMVTGNVFNASEPCTRAAAVTYIWQACGSPTPSAAANFADVPAGADYAQAVAWAVEKGVTTGTSDTTFSPSDICNRGQIVTFLYRAMG